MKFLRYIQKKRRAMFAMAAITLFASPFSAQASNITTKAGVTLKPTNNVYNIAVQQKLSDKVGVNKFTHFDLDKGQIANMQFDKLETLANLVDNKININGTVNALRDGKIGGNLYFLSPNGIAVGASGVINAGSFTGAAVDKDYFENLGKMTDATKFTTAISPDNMIYNNDLKKGIDIQGVINAPGGINLHATKINIGKSAILRTDVSDVDFSKVVNIMSGDKVVVDSGITGGLDAEYKDGDIILKAYAESINDANSLTSEKDVQNAVKNWEKITEREAVINVDGTIKSANDVSINAESMVVFVENQNFNAITQTPVIGGLLKKANLDASLNFAKKTSKATVNIGKTADIYSAGDMDISATSTLNVSIETGTPAQGKSKKYIPATAVGVIVADNQAVVNVEGKLESKGRMTINATANTNLNVDAKTRTNVEDKKDDSSTENSGDSDKNTDKNSSKTDTSSDSSKDSSKTDSSSDSTKDSSKTDTSSDSNKDSSKTDTSSDTNKDSSQDSSSNVVEDRFYVAVGVISGSSKAEVNIKSGSEIKVGAEDTTDKSGNELKAFEANAIVNNELSVTANASSKDKSTINTAVGVVAYNSDAIINVDGKITAENGSISLNASNSTTNSGEISNVLGSEVAPFENPFIIDPENTDNSGSDTGNGDNKGTDTGKTDSKGSDTQSGDNKGSDTKSGDGSLVDEVKKAGKQLIDSEEGKKFIEEAKNTGKELLEGIKTKLKELVKGKGDKKDNENATVPNKVGGKTFTKILDGEYLKAGVAVGVISEKNTANVNIKNKANITAKNNVEINSITEITRQNISVESEVNNLKEEQKTASMVGLGVLVTDIDNNADVVVDGNLTVNEGDVTITTDSGMKYDQFGVLVDDLKETLTKIKKSAEELGEDVKKEVGEKIDGYLNQLTEGTDDKKGSDSKNSDKKSADTKNADSKTSDANQSAGSDEASTLKGNLSKLKQNVTKIAESAKKDFNGIIKKVKNSQLKEDIGNLAGNLTAFVHPANYANYYVRSAFNDSKDADDADSAKIDAAGSISIDTMRNNSRILIGKGNINAENGSVEVNSTAKGGVVAITGMGGEFLTSSEAAKKGAGVSVIVGTFRNNSVVAVGKSAINAGDISLKTTDDSKHVNIIYGNGKADSTTITGMVSYINSPTNSIISIDDSAKLNAENDISLETVGKDYITSVNGGIALENGNGKSFGAALNILSNDKNVAVNIGDNGYLNSKFADNISAFDSKIKALESSDNISDKTEIKILRINKRTHEILGENLFGSLDASAVNSDGVINAKNLTVKSDNGGTINSIAVAGTENSESHGFADGFNDKVEKGETFLNYADDSFKWLSTKILDAFTIKGKDDKLDKSGEKKPDDASTEALEEAGNTDDKSSLLNTDNSVESQLNIAGAGSAAININSGGTGSFISNANLNVDTVNVTANDDTFKGSWAGAGAFNFFGDTEAAKNTNVAIGGSVAYSDNSRNVTAVIKNSEITATSIKNTATRDDSDVAAGLELAVSTNGSDEGKNTNVPISTSINFINGDTHALLLNNSVKNSSIENKAAIDALQVSGGLALGVSKGGEKGFSVGGNAAASKVTNDLQSGIKGGTYENISKVDITADKKSNQVDVAVAGGVVAGDDDGGFAFGGAVAVSDINNKSNAFLNDTTKFNASGVINVDALDSKNESSRNSYLSTRSINTDATEYLANDNKSKIDTINGGGNIVNVAFGAGGATSEAAAGGLAVSYAGISNIVNVDISNNQNISAQNLNANTTNKSNIVNVAAGFAGSKGSFSGAGSVGISDIKNDGTINIANSNVTADNFLSGANSSAHIVNVAGQASLANKFAGGLTFAYNAMNNNTGINVKNGTWNVKDFGANSANNNYALAVGAGVAFSKESSAINGSVGLNMGTNSTKAIIDGLTMSGIKNLKATATDSTSKTTVAGGLTISKEGTVALGGAVAYANIGRDSNKEIINAKVTNSNISAENNSNIEVESLDKAIMTTVGAGAGGSSASLTFQGAAAVSQVNKDNVAEISNSNITGSPDIKIKSTSGGNSSDGLNINGSKIDVNNKIKTASAVLDANLSDDSWFDGAFAITVNKFNQTTTANFKNTSRPEIVSRAGNVDMFSNSEADILGIAIGGAGGKSTISASGSTSLNYINNSAKTLVENANVKADKNFGVVAQSDDKIANYSGAVDIDVNGNGSIGVSVSQNEIKGNTDADIKNSKLEVGGSTAKADLIAISNPKDNLIDGYVTKNTWTSGRLMSGRTTDNKSGLVVNSSATHSISSDLATIGVRATSDSPGVGISGTVNINKIDGGTNAKVEGSDIAGGADSFVNASDYTNSGSFVGNAAASGTVAIGVLWNENQVKRGTNALVDGNSSDDSSKPTLNVKNLEVKADSRQGLSNLNIAVGAAFTASKTQVFAAASGDNIVRNQLDGTTTAKIENATVNHSGAVDVNAYHKDNIFATNIAAGVAVDTSTAGATFDMGYGLMRENSTVKAEINNSTLKSNSGAVNVNAENNSKLAGAFGTAGIAVHAGAPGAAAAVAVGINNNYVTNTVHAGIKDSTLNVGAVDVNAENTSEIKADGGVAAVALNISKGFFAAMGSATAVTNGTFDNKVTADVDNSTINAAGDVNIQARDDHKSDKTVVSAAASTGLAVSVNRMSTSINSGLGDLQADQLGKSLSAGDLVMNSDNASKENSDSDLDKLIGEFGSEKRFINENTVDTLLGGIRANSKATKENISSLLRKRYRATVNYGVEKDATTTEVTYNNKLKSGVFANVTNNSTINAGNKISIGSTENNDLSITSGSGSAGLIGVGVGSTSIKVRRANTANVVGSTLNAKNIEISTTNGQTGEDGIKSRMYNATLTPLGASVGYNNVETNGTGEILISDSTITAAENLNAKAIDNSKSRSYILDAGLKVVGYTGVFAYNTNTAQTGIEVSNKSSLTAPNINFDAENQSYRATDTLAISASGLGVQTNTSKAQDSSNSFINVNGAGNTFTADTLNFNALNGGQTYSHTNGQAYLGLNAVVAKGLANTNSTAKISIDDANTFANTTANITAQIGEEGKYTAESTGFAINGSAVGVNIDDMIAQTNSTAQVTIGNEYYKTTKVKNEETNTETVNENVTTLNVSALNKASRNAFMRNNAYSLVANANDISAYTIAEDKSEITVGNGNTPDKANKLAALNITSDTENKSYVAAKGTGGSIGGDFGSAAHADNSVDNTSEATIGGTWNIANDLTLNANQHDRTYISGYSARGAILTGGKGSLDNVINGKSTAIISDSAQINAKTVNVNSKNFITTDKYSDDYDYTLFGRMGGVVDDVDYQRSSATTNKSANINIGKNAAITTTGTQNYDALSDYDLTNNVYAEGGSLLASLRWVKSHNYITADEKISVGTGATLKNEGGTYEDGGITFAAHDNLELAPTAKGFSQSGLGGYVRAEALTDLTRNQNIDINGTLKSAKDLNLYAGADLDGVSSRVHSYAQAISQVQTLISDGKAEVIRKGATNSNVNVNSGAYGQAVRDVNVISNAGFESYEERPFYGSTWSSDGGYKVVTSDTGDLTTGNYKHNSKVKVDGELKAAATPDIAINISGVALPNGFILADNHFKNLSYNVKSGDITITKKNTDFTGKSSEEIFAQQIYNGITTATTDYANDFLKVRYAEVCQAISNYQVQGRNDVVAYNGFLQEKNALENEMESLGLGSKVNGEFKLGSSPSIEIKTVVLPDVEVSGGSINVSTNNFSGSGKLNASGVPKIDIENKSSAYLVTNRLTIGVQGGAITYNGVKVTSNADIGSGAKFTELKVANSTQVPTISVANNYSGQSAIPMKPNPNAKDYDTLTAEGKKATLTYTPINYIEVSKDITNTVGKVIINNKQGSIRINKGAHVNAMDIEMTAKDSISQGYTEGIVNIAYTPEIVYKDEIAKMRKEIGWDDKISTKDQTVTKTSNDMYTGGSAWQAGNAIYISARDININGLIQSGYAGYTAKITQADIDNATETVFFNDTTMYKVNDGGVKYDNEKGYYVYVPQIYYDKTDNKLYVEDINATSGKIYLSGRISSTGNGKIVVSDGASNIDIRNNSKVDMNVGNVRNSSGGFIQIVDTEQDKLTEYSSGQTRTIDNYSAWLADNTKGKVSTGDGLTIGEFRTYKSKEGLTYNWGEGTSRERTDHYYYKEEQSLWGAIDDSEYTSDLYALSKVVDRMKNDKDYAKKYAEKASIWSEPEKRETLDVGNGIYIGTQNAVNNNLTLLAQNVKTNESYGNHTTDGPDKHGFIGYYRDYSHRWTKTTGAKQIYQYSVKADYPISVGLIGDSNPAINLSNGSTAGGDLYLTGNIRNDVSANLSISARGGKIQQSGGTKISTNNIKLTARDGIENIDLTNHRTDDLKLSAQTTTGDIDVNVTGGILGDRNLAGNVQVNALKSENGGVKLTAQGDIKQTIKGTSVNARNIKLESTGGSINLQIESNGQPGAELSAISAAAQGDIKLTKTDDADFLIGSIVSTNGDVTLTANGKFVDALDKVRDNADTDESDLVKSWIDMGLIAGTADYKGAYITRLETDRDNYKADVTEQFTEYKTLLDDYNARRNAQTAEDIAALEKKFSKYVTVEDYLAADKDYKTAQDKDAYKSDATIQFNQYQSLQKNDRLELLEKKFGKYDTADAYLATDADYQTLVATVKNPVYKWTQDELLSGIRSAIVNKEEGTASDVTKLKDANITARNVTLTGAGVGTNSKETTTIKMSELRIKANETEEEKSARLAKLSQLASVEAADVKVNLALDKDGKPVVQTVTQVNYNYDADKGYYLDKAGNYIRYRKDADGNLLKYTYDKDLKQVGNAVAAKDFSDVIKDTTTIENKEIESFEISSTIPVGINATGNITVKTNGSGGVFIAGRNKGAKIDETTNPNNDVYSALNINKIETAKADGNFGDVRIIGEAGIFNAADSGANVVGKDLVLVGGNGSIGTQNKPFAVTLTGDLLNARSNEEVNLQKVGSDNFRISAIYSPKAIRITNNGGGIIERSLRFDDISAAYLNTPGEITLTGTAGTANNPILIRPTETTIINLTPNSQSLNLQTPNFYIKGLNTGKVNLNDVSGTVDISSEGSIGQTAGGVNSLSSIKVAAQGDVILDGNNKLSTINLGAIGGNFLLKNDSNKLTANFGSAITGDAQINQRGDIALEGAVNGSTLSLTSEKGNIVSTGGLKAAKEINLSVGTFTHEGEIHTDKLTIATDKGVKINNTQNTFNALEITSRNGKAINGSIDVSIKADTFAPTIKNDVTGNVTLKNTKKGGTLSFGDGETINISKTFTAETNDGDFDYGSTLAAKNISISAQNINRRAGTTGYFSATGNLLLNAQNNIGTAENPIWFGNTTNKSAGLDASGKRIYVNGTGNGIFTLGDVVADFMSASSDGSIAQADNKFIKADKIEVSATNDITLDNVGNLIKAATINGDNVKLHSANQDGLTLDGLKAKGDVAITSDKSLTLNGNIESEKNITLTAGTDLTSSKASLLKADKLLTLKADDVKLSGKVETSYKEMTSDKVEDVEKFIAEMPAITVTTNKGLDMTNAANNFEGLYVVSDGEQINGSVKATGNSKGFLAVIDKKVLNDITLKNTKSDGIIILLDKGKLESAEGSITLEMGGDFGAGANILANKDIKITSSTGSITVVKLSSLEKGEISETTSDDTATLKANRNINLKAAKTIDVEGQVTAGRNITAKSSSGINIVGKADVSAGNNIEIEIDKGNLTIEGKLRANNGAIDIELDEGSIQIGKDTPDAETVTAKGDINMMASNGIITISGKTKSTSGNVRLDTNENQPENTSANVLESYSGTPVLYSADVVENYSSGVTPVAAGAKKPGDITVDAEIEANDSVWIVTDEGDIEVTKRITVNNGDIVISTADGDIIVRSNGAANMLSAQNDMDILADAGAVTIAGKIATKDGDITITSNQGTYTTGQKGITVTETGAINPGKNLYLNTTNGDITADTLRAAETLRIALEHGELYLNLAQSKGVAILTGNDSQKSSVQTIRADSVNVDRNIVTVGRILPYASTPTPSNGSANGGGSSGGSASYSNAYSNVYGSGYGNVYSNFASNPSSFATLGSTYTPNIATYWQSADSAIGVERYDFSEFTSLTDDRQTRNYFEVRFIPTWLEKEFMAIDFDYSFDNFGIRNATADELTID